MLRSAAKSNGIYTIKPAGQFDHVMAFHPEPEPSPGDSLQAIRDRAVGAMLGLGAAFILGCEPVLLEGYLFHRPRLTGRGRFALV